MRQEGEGEGNDDSEGNMAEIRPFDLRATRHMIAGIGVYPTDPNVQLSAANSPRC